MENEDHSRNLTRLLVKLCRDFELLQACIKGEYCIVSRLGPSLEAGLVLQEALAQQVLFNSVRAYRIVDKAGANLSIERSLRKKLERELRSYVSVRDQNEHWLDPNRKKQAPKAHAHEDLGVAVDEVSMVILAHDKILMGEINLYNLYCSAVDGLNEIMKSEGAGQWSPSFP